MFDTGKAEDCKILKTAIKHYGTLSMQQVRLALALQSVYDRKTDIDSPFSHAEKGKQCIRLLASLGYKLPAQKVKNKIP